MCDRCWGYDALHPCVCGDVAGPSVPADAGDAVDAVAVVAVAANRAAAFAGGGDESR